MIWSKRLQNAIIVQSFEQNSRKTLEIFSYFPYENGQCGMFDGENIKRMGYFSINRGEKHLLKFDIFRLHDIS